MPFTNSLKVPNLPEDDTPRDAHVIYIEHTKGVWIRTNLQTHELELWVDGQFQSSWAEPATPSDQLDAHIAIAMMTECLAIGKKQRSQEFRRLIDG